MSIKKNKNQLIICILIGLAVFALAQGLYIKQQEEIAKQQETISKLKKVANNTDALHVDENTTVYVVAKEDIEKGHIITNDDIEMKDAGTQIKNAITNKNIVIGAKANKDIKAGIAIRKGLIDIPGTPNEDEPMPGFRAIAATVATNRMAPFIESGAYIDIYTANNTIQASNIRVLKILDSGSKANKLILFEIKEEDVGPFIFAMTTDKLIPVQKNKADKTAYAFAYDPFKYSSYTISSEDMNYAGGSGANIPAPENYEENYVPVNNKKMTRGQTVEVIRGNEVQTLDF